jgi:hypothetical protein
MNALRGRDVVDARDREHDPRLDVAHEIEPKNLADQILHGSALALAGRREFYFFAFFSLGGR